MKRVLFITTIMMGAMFAPTATYAQFGNLKGLAKKAKEKAKETVGSTSENVGSVTNEVTTTTRGAAPWPMLSSEPVYNGKSCQQFLLGIANESDTYITSLRDQMYARYKSNAKLAQSGDMDAMSENQNFQRFYYAINTMVNSNVFNVSLSSNGTVNASDARLLITSEKGAGIGYYAMEKGGKAVFVTMKDDGAFLNAEDLAIAKQAAARMRKLEILTKGLNEAFQGAGEDCDRYLRSMSDYCGIYANIVEKACANNTPENIERKPRPAAGNMHAQLKAQALAVAKAADSDVVDVIITSAQWDVKMKGLIPVNRNVYGYYVVKDEQGLMCVSRMWTEDYLGDGKYGKLRAGGVGTASPFYIK